MIYKEAKLRQQKMTLKSSEVSLDPVTVESSTMSTMQ